MHLMKNSDYWKERFQQLESARHESFVEKIAEIQEQFDKAQYLIEEKINAWYQRFADNNNIALVEAKKLLNSEELREFKWDVNDYIKYGKENAVDGRWMKELENASARVHISRLEQIKIQVQQYVEMVFGNYNDALDGHIKDLYKQDYYHTAFEIQKGIGVGYDFAGVDEEKLSEISNKPWTSDGINFSDRIWSDKKKLINQLQTSLTQMCIVGIGVNKVIKDMTKAMNAKKANVSRLVRTESAYFGSLAQKKCFEELDVERYKIIATLDNRTSVICRDMDGKVFKMSEFEAGLTAPPFHVNCRSCICPYFDDEFATGKRAARGEDGKTYYVPADMTYKEWKEECIKDGRADYVDPKTTQQYNKYKKLLGNEAPNTLIEFAQEKENKTEEYKILKHQVKGMRYYDRAVQSEPLISSAVKQIAQNNNMDIMGFQYRLKTKESFLGKIRRNYRKDKNNFEINDIVRYTLGANNDDLTNKILKCIDEFDNMGYNTVVVKNFWLDDSNPYNGINTIVKAPNGQKFEIQYHTEKSFDLKNGKMHELYEKQRVISDEFSEEYIKLTDEMFKLADELEVPKGIEKVK